MLFSKQPHTFQQWKMKRKFAPNYQIFQVSSPTSSNRRYQRYFPILMNILPIQLGNTVAYALLYGISTVRRLDSMLMFLDSAGKRHIATSFKALRSVCSTGKKNIPHDQKSCLFSQQYFLLYPASFQFV